MYPPICQRVPESFFLHPPAYIWFSKKTKLEFGVELFFFRRPLVYAQNKTGIITLFHCSLRLLCSMPSHMWHLSFKCTHHSWKTRVSVLRLNSLVVLLLCTIIFTVARGNLVGFHAGTLVLLLELLWKLKNLVIGLKYLRHCLEKGYSSHFNVSSRTIPIVEQCWERFPSSALNTTHTVVLYTPLVLFKGSQRIPLAE